MMILNIVYLFDRRSRWQGRSTQGTRPVWRLYFTMRITRSVMPFATWSWKSKVFFLTAFRPSMSMHPDSNSTFDHEVFRNDSTNTLSDAYNSLWEFDQRRYFYFILLNDNMNFVPVHITHILIAVTVIILKPILIDSSNDSISNINISVYKLVVWTSHNRWALIIFRL